MPIDSHIYVFDKFELDETAGIVRAGEEIINLTTTERELLAFLTKNPEKIFSAIDLYEEIFGLEGRSKQNTIPAHISNLKKKLRVYSDNDFIVNVPNAGYRFDAKVAIKLKSAEIPVLDDSTEDKSEDILEVEPKDKVELGKRTKPDIEDGNDDSGKQTLQQVSLSSKETGNLSKKILIHRFLASRSTFIFLITILPIFIIFVIWIWFSVGNDEKEIERVVKESQLYESLVLYKSPKAFEENSLDEYWLDDLDVNINTDRNRIRGAVLKLKNEGRHYGDETKCEQFELQSIEITKNGDLAVVKTFEKWFVAVYFEDGTLQKNRTVGPYFVSYILRKRKGKWLIEKSTTARVDRPTPQIINIELISEPRSRQQFFVKITGEDFEPETVLIEVVGEGCPDNNPCKVPNSALRENSKMSETVLDNVPLTLAAGNFRIVTRNGDSQPSNSVAVNVP